MGKILSRLSMLFVALATAIIDTVFPLGTYIIRGLSKFLGFDFAGREGSLFDVAVNVVGWIFEKLLSFIPTSDANSYLSVWDQTISMIRAWDLIFPIHEIFFFIAMMFTYFVIKYAVLFCMWCVRRVADIIP